jgi:hypothetical protein
MLTSWKWKVSGAVVLALLGLLTGTLLLGGAWLLSLLGLRFILALGGVGAFLGWGWSFGKPTPPLGRRIVRVARLQQTPPAGATVPSVCLPDSIRRRMESLGCAPL